MAILRSLILIIAISLSSTQANIEGDALYALRRAVRDPGHVLQSWDPTLVDPCTWFHVTCDGDDRVTRLDLGNANLSGNLVPELGKLERLQYLELYMNNLSGPIPDALGNLKSLVSLDLFHNNLTGHIPASLSMLSNLRFMRLNSNRLSGRIPRELTKLTNLKILLVLNQPQKNALVCLYSNLNLNIIQSFTIHIKCLKELMLLTAATYRAMISVVHSQLQDRFRSSPKTASRTIRGWKDRSC